MTHETNNGMVCPITGKRPTRTWTNHAKPGVFNECPFCAPENDKTLAQRLHELNEQRKVKVTRKGNEALAAYYARSLRIGG